MWTHLAKDTMLIAFQSLGVRITIRRLSAMALVIAVFILGLSVFGWRQRNSAGGPDNVVLDQL